MNASLLEEKPTSPVALRTRAHKFGGSSLADAGRIRQVLVPGGLLLCRLNSTEDRHFGARGHPVIEPHYHLVDGTPKRFFTEAAVREMFWRRSVMFWVNEADMDGSLLGMDYLGRFRIEIARDCRFADVRQCRLDDGA